MTFTIVTEGIERASGGLVCPPTMTSHPLDATGDRALLAAAQSGDEEPLRVLAGLPE